jgi:hypothetical protein
LGGRGRGEVVTRRKVGQEFRADVIQRWTDEHSRLLWFSTDPKKAPPQVCLLITSVRGDRGKGCALELELNGQENSRNGLEVAVLEASRTMLLIGFRRGYGVHPGYVDASEARTVLGVKVRFALSDRDFAYLADLLSSARQDGCTVRCRPGAKPRRKPVRVITVPPR